MFAVYVLCLDGQHAPNPTVFGRAVLRGPSGRSSALEPRGAPCASGSPTEELASKLQGGLPGGLATSAAARTTTLTMLMCAGASGLHPR